MLVELKNGETLNGHLVNCDTWMNLTLKDVVQTSPEGDRFWRLAEVYVRGNNVCFDHLFAVPPFSPVMLSWSPAFSPAILFLVLRSCLRLYDVLISS